MGSAGCLSSECMCMFHTLTQWQHTTVCMGNIYEKVVYPDWVNVFEVNSLHQPVARFAVTACLKLFWKMLQYGNIMWWRLKKCLNCWCIALIKSIWMKIKPHLHHLIDLNPIYFRRCFLLWCLKYGKDITVVGLFLFLWKFTCYIIWQFNI